MENRVIDDAILREYLLGRLETDQELVERIDEQMLTDPVFSMNVDIIEDEIIEEYLEETLDAADSRAVEQHFLRPPERQRKLRNARLLSRHLADASPHANHIEKSIPTRKLDGAWLSTLTPPSLRTCAEIAASILFAASVLYLWNQQRKLEIAVKQSNLQTAQEGERSVPLDRQLQAILPPTQSSTVMLSLVTPGLLRGDAHLPEAKLPIASKTLHIEVALTFGPFTNYQVQLKHEGTVVWSQSGVHATVVPGGSILPLTIPTDAVPSGMCELAITSTGKPLASYWFLVAKLP
jgi:hypothetical protein